MSGKSREDTKKERKLEFTCLGRAQKTRRKRKSRNLRVRGEFGRHEERRKAEIYVSERRPEDTKKWEKSEFTCQRGGRKTRRNEERGNLRVREEAGRHEEREKAVIYVSRKRQEDTKKERKL